MSSRTKNPPLAVVKVGYTELLMPTADAIKLMTLLQGARLVNAKYSDAIEYHVGAEVDVEMRSVRAEQLVLPAAEVSPARPIRRGPLKLGAA